MLVGVVPRRAPALLLHAHPALVPRAGPPIVASASHSVLDVWLHSGLNLVNYMSGYLLLFACFVALINTLVFFANGLFKVQIKTPLDFVKAPGGIPSLTSIRFSLCSMILVALNFLVAVDVIETLIKPAALYTLRDLYKLALVAGVRTLLAYFLGKETE